MKRIFLIGIGGYGNVYVNALLDGPVGKDYQIVGYTDPAPQGCTRLAELEAVGCRAYASAEAFYEKHAADLTIISAPIQYHPQYACLAMEAGSHVLCEKPAAATLAGIAQMRSVQQKTNKLLGIGFQWCYAEAMLRLKADILSGKFGAPQQLKVMVLWPRDDAYYARGVGWAGKRTDSAGAWILDSVALNATAHYLQNMLWITGAALDQTARVSKLRAETYRANHIEMYDTIVLQGQLDNGAELHYVASHAIESAKEQGPVFAYRFDRGVVEYTNGGCLQATFADGSSRNYGDPFACIEDKLVCMLRAMDAADTLPCTLDTAEQLTRCIGAVDESSRIVDLQPWAAYDEDRLRTWVPGLAEVLQQCYDQLQLPSQTGAVWAESGEWVCPADIPAAPRRH